MPASTPTSLDLQRPKDGETIVHGIAEKHLASVQAPTLGRD
jgi:hypothetical protein